MESFNQCKGIKQTMRQDIEKWFVTVNPHVTKTKLGDEEDGKEGIKEHTFLILNEMCEQWQIDTERRHWRMCTQDIWMDE